MRFEPCIASVRGTRLRAHSCALFLIGALVMGLPGCVNPSVPAQNSLAPAQSLAGVKVNAGSHTAEVFLPTSFESYRTLRARTDAKDEESFQALGRLLVDKIDSAATLLVVHFYPTDAPPPPAAPNAEGTLGSEFERWIIGSYTWRKSGAETVSARRIATPIPIERIGNQVVEVLLQPHESTLRGPTQFMLLNYVIAMDDPADVGAREAIANHYADLHPESLSLTITLLPRSARWKDYPMILPHVDPYVAGQLFRFKDGPVEWKPKD